MTPFKKFIINNVNLKKSFDFVLTIWEQAGAWFILEAEFKLERLQELVQRSSDDHICIQVITDNRRVETKVERNKANDELFFSILEKHKDQDHTEYLNCKKSFLA